VLYSSPAFWSKLPADRKDTIREKEKQNKDMKTLTNYSFESDKNEGTNGNLETDKHNRCFLGLGSRLGRLIKLFLWTKCRIVSLYGLVSNNCGALWSTRENFSATCQTPLTRIILPNEILDSFFRIISAEVLFFFFRNSSIASIMMIWRLNNPYSFG